MQLISKMSVTSHSLLSFNIYYLVFPRLEQFSKLVDLMVFQVSSIIFRVKRWSSSFQKQLQISQFLRNILVSYNNEHYANVTDAVELRMAIKSNLVQCKLTDFRELRSLIYQTRPVLVTWAKHMHLGALLFMTPDQLPGKCHIKQKRHEDLMMLISGKLKFSKTHFGCFHQSLMTYESPRFKVKRSKKALF